MQVATTVDFSPLFHREVKRLKKRFPAVLDEVTSLIETLEKGEHPGDKVAGIGHDAYKVRLANPSSRRGKSGGFRVIYYVQTAEYVYLLTIYSKSRQQDIRPERIRRIIEELL